MITLHQLPPAFGLPSASPICMKLELWLKMAGFDYQCRYHFDPRSAPRAKLPFIEVEGRSVPDSNGAIKYLKQQRPVVLDNHLMLQQVESAKAWLELLEEQLNLVLTFTRFNQPENWETFRQAVFGGLPEPEVHTLPEELRESIVASLNTKGLTEQRSREISRQAMLDIDVIVEHLGDQQYFFGNRLSSIDASAVAVLMHTLAMPWQDDLALYVQQQANLKGYCYRVMSQFFPEAAAIHFLTE